MIVTLAGHVDHGKTSLVRALTGVDTDRLKEEKQRGLTIDLGFAYDDKAGLGFVDVPGHHRFIHNMVAGIAAHQFALLVIAADDGPMPQTREHLNILGLLGLKNGVVALTKIDTVDEEHLELVHEEIAELLAGTFLQDAQIFPCASTDGTGVDEIRQTLTRAATQHQHNQTPQITRLPVDRAFNVRGSGTVVTGTLYSGQITIDQQLQIFPGAQRVRVRSVHADHKEANASATGQRTALNLVGVDVEDVPRGSWVTESLASASNHLTLDLTVLADFPRPLKHWTPVHVYHATHHTLGRIALLESESLAPGESGIVDLQLDEPLLTLHGDRILLRDQSLDVTLGGGTVVDNLPPTNRRRDPSRLARLAVLTHQAPLRTIEALLTLEPQNLNHHAALLGLARQTLELPPQTKIIDEWAVHPNHYQAWREAILTAVEQALKADQALVGLRENELPDEIPERFRGNVLRELLADGVLEEIGGAYHLPKHQAKLTPKQAQLLDQVTPVLDNLQPPSLGDIAKHTGLPLHQLTKDLTQLAKTPALEQIGSNRFYLPERLTEIAHLVGQLAAAAPFDVKAFRDATGIGRNVAIDVLEHFDRLGYTRRQGDVRIVAREWRQSNK